MEAIFFDVKFLVKTDHNSMKYLLTQKIIAPEQKKWVSKIQVFDFDILYKKGKENRVADNLSRKPKSDASLCAISIVVPEWILEVQSEYVKYPETRKLIEEVENNKATNSKYSWEKDILWYKQRIYLPSSSKFKTEVLKENHDSLLNGPCWFL